MTRLTSKGIYTVKIQNHPCAIMLPKSKFMRRGGYKCRTLEIHLELRNQQLKTISYKGTPVRLSADFSTETLQARREWHDILNVMKGKTSSQDYSTQQGSRSDLKEKSKPSQIKQKLREFSNTKPALQQILKQLL